MSKDCGERYYGTRSTINQVVVTLVSNSALFSSGMTLGFTAVALPYMLLPNDLLTVNSSEASWIASLAAIATPLGCLMSGPIIDRFGRRMGLFALNVPAFIGWLCIAIRPTLAQVFLGRILTGIACGISSTPATVYIAEVASSSLRGLFVTGSSIAISAGVAIVYTFGLIFKENWPMVAALCSLFPVLSTLLIWTQMPESPVWLLAHNKEEEAASSLRKLRGVQRVAQIRDELNEMSAQVKSRSTVKESFRGTFQALCQPESYKPLILMNLFFLFQQLAGIFVVIFYAVNVVKEAGVTTDPFIVAVVIGLTRLLFTVLAAYMSKKMGRRPSALISGVGMTISLLVLATHLLMAKQEELEGLVSLGGNQSPNGTVNSTTDFNSTATRDSNSEDDGDTSLVPIISIIMYILTSTLGFLTLPWAMIGEVFPSRVRGMAGGITTCLTYTVSFFAVKLYPTMIESMDKHGVFYFYGGMSLAGTIFVFFFLPETQGKSLAQIEAYFAGKRKQTSQEEEEALNGTKLITIVPKGKISADT